MKKILGALFTLLLIGTAAIAQTKKIDAFPGAEGAGRYTTGGRGGAVYHVTSLADDGSKGTLRYAINQKGARTIVFDVGGVIELKSALSIRNGDLTIAGQTAPGDGIVLRNYGLNVAANNVIIRYIHARLGDGISTCEDDAVSAFSSNNGLKDIIFDHVSASWSIDECLSSYGVQNLTVQWCMITESLYHSIHGKGAHGYGGIWGGCPATFHHNLIAHHSSRTPRLCGSRYNNNPASEMVDIRNNVFYNFGPTNGGYAGEGGSYNFINNTYKPGPITATKSNLCNRIFQANPDDGSNKQPAGVWGIFHLSGNWFDTSCPDLSDSNRAKGEAVNQDNWSGLHVSTTPPGGKISIQSSSPFACASVTTHSAEDAYLKVLEHAGCSYSRDAIDTRIVSEVATGTYTYSGSKGGKLGLIDTPSDVDGYGIYKATSKSVDDSNNNGIPDNTEEILFGELVDGNGYNKSSDYTNLEYYLNALVSKITASQLDGGVPSVDGTGSDGGSSDMSGNDAFMATKTDNGYDYFWFNTENGDQVNEWINNGTITINNGSFNASFSNSNSTHTGALALKSGTGEVIFKCPSISSFSLYMFRTGSFSGDVYISTDGVEYEQVHSYTGSKYIMELDLTSVVQTTQEVYVKVTNTSTGSLQIQGAKILKPQTTGIEGSMMIAKDVYFTGNSVTAPNARNIRAYNLDGTCVADSHSETLYMTSLPQGVYTIRIITSDGRIWVRKVVK